MTSLNIAQRTMQQYAQRQFGGGADYANDKGSLKAVAVGTTSTLLVGADPQRVAVTISAPLAHRITISDRPGLAIDQGLTIQAGANPLTLTIHQCGDWLQRGLYAIADTAAQTVGVLEVICPCREPPLAP